MDPDAGRGHRRRPRKTQESSRSPGLPPAIHHPCAVAVETTLGVTATINIFHLKVAEDV
jgi:hypothetical protein